MRKDRLERRLRLALSWRDTLLRRHAVNVRRGIDGTHRVSLSKRGTHPVEAAESHIEKLRHQARREAARAATDLRRALHARERLLARAAAGQKTNLRRLNRRSRALAARINRGRKEVARLNALVSAETGDQAGGYVEMPENAYAKALRQARGNPWQGVPAEDRRTIVLGTLAVVLAVLGVIAYARWDEGVRFEAGFTGTDQSVLRIVCVNNTPSPIVLHMPWPGEVQPGKRRQAYGANLYVSLDGGKTFRLFPSAGKAWTYQGTPTLVEEPIQVPPRMRTEVMLELPALNLPGDGKGLLRLLCTRGDGKEVLRFGWEQTEKGRGE